MNESESGTRGEEDWFKQRLEGHRKRESTLFTGSERKACQVSFETP